MRGIATIMLAAGLAILGTPDTWASATGHGKPGTSKASGDHGTMGGGMMPRNLDEMRKEHQEHEHGHDFKAMEQLSDKQRDRVMSLMHDIGVAIPPMDSRRGRALFVQKGCVACHSVNNVGGDIGPALNAADMPRPMNAFDFTARMWRGAQAMAALQEDLFGEVIALDGQDLADLVAFAHDADEQAQLSKDQIPEKFQAIIRGE